MFFQLTKEVLSYLLIDNPKKLSWLLNELSGLDEFSFDIETNHPTAGNKKPSDFVECISGVSFAWGRKSVEFPWKHGNAAYIPLTKFDDSPFWNSRQDAVVAAVKEILESDVPKVAQYGKFDIYKLCKLLNIMVKNFSFDTHLAHSLLDEERTKSSHALKSDFDKSGKTTKLGMADVYLGMGASQFKDDLESAMDHYDPIYRRYSKVPLDILYVYGCSDSDYTLSLKHVFEPMLEREGMTWVFQNIVMKLQTELAISEICGMPLDLEVANEIKVKQEEIMNDCLAEAKRICKKDVDLASPTQVGKVLFEDLAIPGGKRNKQGWMTESEILSDIDHPIIDVILHFRRAQKIYGSFVMPALEKVEEITNDGRVGWVHMTYFPDSLTGRLRGSDPNLTALPRPENGGDIVKSMWAGGGDYKFIFKDYSQIELRFIAHCSDEPIWIDGFNKGYDMHAAMAQRIWHPDKSIDEVKLHYQEDRSNAKAVNFGIAFGKSIYTLSQDLGISYEEADKLINTDYFGAAPTLKGWIDYIHEFARLNGYVYNIFGRRRHLPNAMLKIPEYLRWPDRMNRPSCYRMGPSFNLLSLDNDWNENDEDSWYKLIDRVDEGDIKELINKCGNNYFGKCLGCKHMFSCVFNTEVKRISGLVGKAMRQAVNSPIQGGASDMINLAWIRIGQELRRQKLDAYIPLDVHDELVGYSHVSCVEATSRIMDYYMTTNMREFTQFKVPLVVDTSIVSRWSDKYDK